MSSEITYRRATAEDAEGIATVLRHFHGDQIHSSVNLGDGMPHSVAVDSTDRVVGVAGLDHAGDKQAVLKNIYVLPEAQNRDVELNLLMCATVMAMTSGSKSMACQTRGLHDFKFYKSNLPAIHLVLAGHGEMMELNIDKAPTSTRPEGHMVYQLPEYTV